VFHRKARGTGELLVLLPAYCRSTGLKQSSEKNLFVENGNIQRLFGDAACAYSVRL